MARTTFSGPVRSTNGFEGDITGAVTGTVTGTVILPTATAANLGLAANAINTTGKVVGKMVVDIATGRLYTATGTAAVDPWVASDGDPLSKITPA